MRQKKAKDEAKEVKRLGKQTRSMYGHLRVSSYVRCRPIVGRNYSGWLLVAHSIAFFYRPCYVYHPLLLISSVMDREANGQTVTGFNIIGKTTVTLITHFQAEDKVSHSPCQYFQSEL